MTSEQNQEALQDPVHRIKEVLHRALGAVQESIWFITGDMAPRTRLVLVLRMYSSPEEQEAVMKIKPGDPIIVIEEVVGYYIKEPCKVQMSINIPKRYVGVVMQVKPIEALIHFERIPQSTWVPIDKIEVQK